MLKYRRKKRVCRGLALSVDHQLMLLALRIVVRRRREASFSYGLLYGEAPMASCEPQCEGGGVGRLTPV